MGASTLPRRRFASLPAANAGLRFVKVCHVAWRLQLCIGRQPAASDLIGLEPDNGPRYLLPRTQGITLRQPTQLFARARSAWRRGIAGQSRKMARCSVTRLSSCAEHRAYYLSVARILGAPVGVPGSPSFQFKPGEQTGAEQVILYYTLNSLLWLATSCSIMLGPCQVGITRCDIPEFLTPKL